MVDNQLLTDIGKQRWTFAKTYADTNPHEYFMVKDNVGLSYSIKGKMEMYGYTKPFYNVLYNYVNINGYKYWVVGDVLNREPLGGYTPEQIIKYKQQGHTNET